MIGAATLDRLRHGAYKLVLDEESYRALPPELEASKPPIEKGRKSLLKCVNINDANRLYS
jgi:hypothetical protein